MVAKEIARRYGDQGIVSIAVNPGMVTRYCDSVGSPVVNDQILDILIEGNLDSDAQRHVTGLQKRILVCILCHNRSG